MAPGVCDAPLVLAVTIAGISSGTAFPRLKAKERMFSASL